jgi:hypothetical protein
MWFRPDVYKARQRHRAEDVGEYKAMLETTKDKPGAMALGAKDDWNLTDWFESIYIRQAAWTPTTSCSARTATGPTRASRRPSTPCSRSSTTSTSSVASRPRRPAWTDAIAQVFGPTPKAGTFYEGGFVGGSRSARRTRTSKIGETIDWYPFPTVGNTDDVTTFGGDVVGA